MADTGAPLSLTLMEVGQGGKEALYNSAMTTINANIGMGGGGAIHVMSTLAYESDISPTQIAANTDNYAPTGIATATILRLTTDASRNLTGITTGADGRVLLLLNVGSFPLVLKDDVTSTAANRFQLAGDVTLQPDEGAILWYDSTSSRWRLVSNPYTDEKAQDAIGAMVDTTLVYTDVTPLLSRAAFTGDVTASAGSNAMTIPNDTVTYAKMQNVSATNRLLGRSTAGAGDVEELTVGGDLTQSGSSFTVVSASDSVAGKVALASIAETNTGTDATMAVTPDGLAGSIFGTFIVSVPLGDPNGAAMTTGDGKAYWFVPFELDGCDLVSVSMGVTTVSSGGIPTAQIANVTQAADMLTTKLTVDAGEFHSKTAATPAVIDTGNDDVAWGDMLRFDFDVAGTGTKGPIVTLGFRKP